jgi:hypothetical protein
VDEYADGDGLNALRTREADLDKHLVNDREQEGEKPSATSWKNSCASSRWRKTQAAGIRQRRRLPAAAGAEPPERPAGADRQTGHHRGAGRRPA